MYDRSWICGVTVSPLYTSASIFGNCTSPGDGDECREVGRIRIGKRNLSTGRKRTPVLLCAPQIPHDLIWSVTRATAVGTLLLAAPNSFSVLLVALIV
jgi:hypothetical protein